MNSRLLVIHKSFKDNDFLIFFPNKFQWVTSSYEKDECKWMMYMKLKEHRPVFLAFTSMGDIGLLLLVEAELLLVREILGGFFRPPTPVCLWLSGSTSAAHCTSALRWALFCCRSCYTPPEGDTRQCCKPLQLWEKKSAWREGHKCMKSNQISTDYFIDCH